MTGCCTISPRGNEEKEIQSSKRAALSSIQNSTFIIQNSVAVSAAQPGLAIDRIRELSAEAPTESVQKSIATHLDRKTAAIDALIEKKRRLLELLAEERTALINQAVTKGLDPDVSMKDSGIPWIGEVPRHWTVKRLKFLAEVRGGVTKGQKFGETPTVHLPYLRVANVQDGHVALDEVYEIEVKRTDAERYQLRCGDILMNEGGDNDKLGRGAVWEAQIVPCLHQNHVFAVRPKTDMNLYWINLATQSTYLKHYFLGRAKQSTNLASISSTNVKEAPIIWPPESEQESTLAIMDVRLSTMDGVKGKLKTQLDRLHEYRQALITAAVTGQIDIEAAA